MKAIEICGNVDGDNAMLNITATSTIKNFVMEVLSDDFQEFYS